MIEEVDPKGEESKKIAAIMTSQNLTLEKIVGKYFGCDLDELFDGWKEKLALDVRVELKSAIKSKQGASNGMCDCVLFPYLCVLFLNLV